MLHRIFHSVPIIVSVDSPSLDSWDYKFTFKNIGRVALLDIIFPYDEVIGWHQFTEPDFRLPDTRPIEPLPPIPRIEPRESLSMIVTGKNSRIHWKRPPELQAVLIYRQDDQKPEVIYSKFIELNVLWPEKLNSHRHVVFYRRSFSRTSCLLMILGLLAVVVELWFLRTK